VKRIPVITESHHYDVFLDAGLLAEAGALLRSELKLQGEKLVVVSAETIWRHWGEALARSLDIAQLQWHSLLVPDGEQAKNFLTVERAAEQLVALSADRSTILVAFGGGVIGDMAGFLAAIYMRGIRVIQIPTTLLAQVDASIGGKTGVNLASGKNLIGSFHQPECVIIDPLLTNTLDDREFRAGLFEVIKCGIITDPSLFQLLESEPDRILAREPAYVTRCVEASVRIKSGIVSKDERESGLRRVLNYGHTIGHALEADTHYSHFLHGEAVAWGMIAAAQIGTEVGISDEGTAQRIRNLILRYGPLPPVPDDSARIAQVTFSDKKTIDGKTHWVLASRIGSVEICSKVSFGVITNAITHIQKISQAQ
jgi:3-dehydroquinate synthase